MSKVHIELSMDKKQLLVAFLQDVDGNMDTYRKHVLIRNAFDLENFQLFCSEWRSELRRVNKIVVGSGIDIVLTMWHYRHQTYRNLYVTEPVEDSDENVEAVLPAKMQEYVEAAKHTSYDVSLELLKQLRSDMATKKWGEARSINQQTGKIETVNRIVTMDEAQVIVEFNELLSSVLNIKKAEEDAKEERI